MMYRHTEEQKAVLGKYHMILEGLEDARYGLHQLLTRSDLSLAFRQAILQEVRHVENACQACYAGTTPDDPFMTVAEAEGDPSCADLFDKIGKAVGLSSNACAADNERVSAIIREIQKLQANSSQIKAGAAVYYCPHSDKIYTK